jgi:hypothetical protein
MEVCTVGRKPDFTRAENPVFTIDFFLHTVSQNFHFISTQHRKSRRRGASHPKSSPGSESHSPKKNIFGVLKTLQPAENQNFAHGGQEKIYGKNMDFPHAENRIFRDSAFGSVAENPRFLACRKSLFFDISAAILRDIKKQLISRMLKIRFLEEF